MSKSLNVVLAELGYETFPGNLPGKKKIKKDGHHYGEKSSGECWNFLRRKHPEYFGEVAK